MKQNKILLLIVLLGLARPMRIVATESPNVLIIIADDKR